MLRLTIANQRESVLLVAQTRDRNGHAADCSDVTDSTKYGTNPALGYAAQPANSIGQYPYYDLKRDGTFDSVLMENDVISNPALPGFYEHSQELSLDGSLFSVPMPALDPNDSTRTLWMYLGREFHFHSIYFNLATPGAFTSAALEVQYWNGNVWQEVPSRVDGDRLDSMLGLSDQVSWEHPSDWFPKRIENQLISTEGSRLVVSRSCFWVRVRLSSIVGFSALPALAGIWEGDPDAEATPALWCNVENPEKGVILRGRMRRDPNAHLPLSLVTSRKQPAEISSGTFDFGKGDYYVQIPLHRCGVSDVIARDPAQAEYRCTGVNKNGTAVTIPIPSTGFINRPGRYRIRVYGEVPNLDASIFAGESGHQEFVPDPALANPADPESQFDPTWNPALTALSASFDVCHRNAAARVEIQRLPSGIDAYSIWCEADGQRLLLSNQAMPDYARLRVQDASTGAVIIDTMQAGLCVSPGVLTAQAGVGGVDMDTFRYTESDSSRKLQDRGQYHLTVWVVRGEEAFVSRVEVNFFA